MTSTGFWQVNLIKNGNKFSKLDLFESLEDANNSARKFWDQFDKEGLDSAIISDEPNQPYDGFQCVDYGSASFKVYVEECHIKDLKVPELKKLAKKKNVDVKGLKKAEILELLLPLCQQEIKENTSNEEKNKETENVPSNDNNNNQINNDNKIEDNKKGNSNEISPSKSRPKRKLSIKKKTSEDEEDESDEEKEDKNDEDYDEELPQMIKIKKTPVKKKLKVDNNEDKKTPTSTKKTPVKEDDYENMKIVDLRNLCVERGLKKSGAKAQLIERLKNPDDKSNKTKEKIVQDYNKMKIGELKELCREAGVKVAGSKSELILRLMNPNKKENRPNPLPFGGRNHRHNNCNIF